MHQKSVTLGVAPIPVIKPNGTENLQDILRHATVDRRCQSAINFRIRTKHSTPTSSIFDSPKAIQSESIFQLVTLLRFTLEEQQEVAIGDYRFRILARNDEFVDHGKLILAVASGLFIRIPIKRGNAGAGGRWLQLGDVDNDEVAFFALMSPYLPKSEMEISALHLSLG